MAIDFNNGGRGPTMGTCRDCATPFFPSPERCMSCDSTRIDASPLPQRGALYAYSTVHVGASRFPRPYIVAYADLANGLRVFGRLERPAPLGVAVDISVGAIGCEPDGPEVSGLVFSPVEGGAS